MITNVELARLLEDTAAGLDIPPELAEEAILEYEEVGAWLNDETSALHQYSPRVYPQGSFRLGTPVRPLRPEDEFDIDLVCKDLATMLAEAKIRGATLPLAEKALAVYAEALAAGWGKRDGAWLPAYWPNSGSR